MDPIHTYCIVTFEQIRHYTMLKQAYLRKYRGTLVNSWWTVRGLLGLFTLLRLSLLSYFQLSNQYWANNENLWLILKMMEDFLNIQRRIPEKWWMTINYYCSIIYSNNLAKLSLLHPDFYILVNNGYLTLWTLKHWSL